MTCIITKKEAITTSRYSKTVPDAPLGTKIMVRKNIRKKVHYFKWHPWPNC